MVEQIVNRRRYVLWVGAALLALFGIVIVSIIGYDRYAAVDSRSTGTTGSTGTGTISVPQPLLSGSKKATESVVSGPVPVYKQLTGSRFFLPSLFGLALLVIGVAVVTVWMLNQEDHSLVVRTKDEENMTVGEEDESEEFWFNLHPLWSALIVAGAVLFIVIVVVVVSRFFRSTTGDVKKNADAKPMKNAVSNDYSTEAEQAGVYDNGAAKVYAKAIHDYTIVFDTEHPCKNGTVYLITNVDVGGLSYQVHNKETNKLEWLPTNIFVTKVGGSSDWKNAKVTAKDLNVKAKALTQKVKVINDYTGKKKYELSVKKGEILDFEITFCYVKRSSDKVSGMVPSYTFSSNLKDTSKGTMMFDYTATSNLELTVSKGDQVEFLGYYHSVKRPGTNEVGLVPTDHAVYFLSSD